MALGAQLPSAGIPTRGQLPKVTTQTILPPKCSKFAVATKALASIESLIRLCKEIPFAIKRWHSHNSELDNILIFKLWNKITKLGRKRLPLWDDWEAPIPALAWLFRLTTKLEAHAKTLAFN